MKLLLFLTLFFSVCTAFAQHPDDYRWDGRFGLPGVSFPESSGYPIFGISAMASAGDYIIVCGQFTVPGNNIALWNKRTNSWEKAGEGITSSRQFAPVSGIFAEGSEVVVWGDFNSAGGKTARRMAAYNLSTKEWTADTLLDGSIYSAVRYGGSILFSGDFKVKGTSIKNLARWDGKEWKEFTADTMQLLNYANLAVFQNRLYAVGRIQTSAARPLLFMWSGSQWEKVIDIETNSASGVTAAPALYRIVADKSLYIYGRMDSLKPAGGQMMPCRSFARFDGATWEAIADTIGFYGSSALQSMCAAGNDLYLGGDIASVNGITTTGVARFDAAARTWNALGSGIPWSQYGRNVRSIVADGADIYAGGQFDIAGAQYVNNVARYSPSTSEWSPLGDANIHAPSKRANVFADNGQMIAVGDFEYAGGKQINYIGSWNGREWNPLGSGIVGGAYKVSGKPSFTMWQRGINNCVRYQNDLHIAGTYEGIGSIVCGNVTRYDKGRLQCLDSGVRESVMQTPVGSSFYYTSFVSDMAAIGNNLYVAGNFTKAGNITANCAARWDGSTWKAMGNTKDILPYYPLRLSVDSTGGLLLAGSFTMIDGQRCNGLARWNGAQWSPVGFSQPADTMHINAICVAPNNDIYIAAQSRQQNGLQTERIKRWNGIAWQDLGGLFPDSTSYCTAIAVKGDLLYVAGKFSQAGTTNAINVAMLNTKTLEWLPLGSGLTVGTLNRTIQSIAFVGDTVYFGGGISYAGGKPSFNIAAWLPANTSSVEQLSAEIPENIGLTVSPNPVSTNGTFEFHLANRGNVRLVLADALGREVITVAEGIFAAGSYRATADVSLLPAGVYYARLQTAHGATGRAAVIER